MNGETAAGGSQGREVAGEPGVYWCAKHPKTKTRLRCGRCEAPICPKCTIYGPSGARCPNCASYKGTHLYQVSTPRYVAAAVVAVGLGMAAAFVAGFIFIFAIFYAPVAGTFIAKVVSAAAGNKRGTPLALVASGGVVLGALLSQVVLPLLAARSVAAAATAHGALPFSAGAMLVDLLVRNAFVWLYLAIGVPSIWFWLK